MNGFQKPHVVAMPFPALGHSIPFLDLAKLLASEGLIVSYVTTPASMSRVQEEILKAVSLGFDIRLVVLPTPLVEGLPSGRESTDLVPRESESLIFQLAEKLEEPFNNWIQRQFDEGNEEQTPPPVCIIHDLFIDWTFRTAEKYKIASVLFESVGAFATSLLHSASISTLQNSLQKEGDSVVLSVNLPRPLRLYRHEISKNFSETDLSNQLFKSFLRRFQGIRKDWGMLMNTFHELEPAYLQNLRNITGKPVWAIGPVLPLNFLGGTENVSARGKTADIGEEGLVGWLDSQSLRSVVYVSFGSQTFLSEQQTNALARGLEASGQPFVWSVKVPSKIESQPSDPTHPSMSFLPEGFVERTKDRGLVIWGWTPQLVILSHRAIGAFMSHCGWNSTLESISLGVPLIAWPMYADQHFNSKLVAELGVGIQFCQHIDGIPNEERVKEVVTLVLDEDKGKEMRKSAEKLKDIARKSGEHGGSSREAMRDFACYAHKLNIR